MAKRDPEPEAPQEDLPEAELPTVGERLRSAREEKGLSLDDVAAQTRIPLRHLSSIETAEWDSLPAPTYTIGFAKSYASAVGLDRTEIGNQLREEMGGQRFASGTADVFEPADPRRTMPKGLVIGALVAVVVLVVVLSYLNKRSLEQPAQQEAASTSTTTTAPAATVSTAPAPAPAAAAAKGPIVLTATAPAWIQVKGQGKTLFEGMLQPGQTYNVPQTATTPTLKAGKPEALKITVGTAVAPPIGPPGKVTTVSLDPAALMKGPAAAAPITRTPTPPPAPAPQATGTETPAGNTAQ